MSGFNSKRATKDLLKKFEDFKRNKRSMDRFARYTERNIKADTRSGISYTGEKFPSLKASTIRWRKYYSKFNPKGVAFRPSKANATFMGDFINGIKVKFTGYYIEITVKGNHRRIKKKKGYIKGSNVKLWTINENLKKLGYKILGASKKSKHTVKVEFERYLRRVQ